MSLPVIGGGPPRRPTTPPSHAPLALDKLMRLGANLADAAEDEECTSLTPEFIDEVADDLGVPSSHLYAAAAMTTRLPFTMTEPVRFTVCVAGCQGWGSLDRLDQLLELRAQRLDNGKPAFDVHARGCLDQCGKAPTVTLHTPHGVAMLAATSDTSIHEAVATALDEE